MQKPGCDLNFLAILTRKFVSSPGAKLANLHLHQTEIQHSRKTSTTPIMSCRRTLLQRERELVYRHAQIVRKILLVNSKKEGVHRGLGECDWIPY